MATSFEKLRQMLRDAGCRLDCAKQTPAPNGAMLELWFVHVPNRNLPVRIMVVNEGESGYQMFIETQTMRIADDVAAILNIDSITFGTANAVHLAAVTTPQPAG